MFQINIKQEILTDCYFGLQVITLINDINTFTIEDGNMKSIIVYCILIIILS